MKKRWAAEPWHICLCLAGMKTKIIGLTQSGTDSQFVLKTCSCQVWLITVWWWIHTGAFVIGLSFQQAEATWERWAHVWAKNTSLLRTALWSDDDTRRYKWQLERTTGVTYSFQLRFAWFVPFFLHAIALYEVHLVEITEKRGNPSSFFFFRKSWTKWCQQFSVDSCVRFFLNIRGNKLAMFTHTHFLSFFLPPLYLAANGHFTPYTQLLICLCPDALWAVNYRLISVTLTMSASP